jgi:xanthine dehydrogenase small subunit
MVSPAPSPEDRAAATARRRREGAPPALNSLPVSGSGSIRFVLNGEPVELTDIAPQTTLLQFLREHCGLTGTKEGCAEGDCGACAVVVARITPSGALQFRAINACLRLLPTVDAMAVFTVEGLGSDDDGRLHPVQQALVDLHGSQCGFCTPGFVMSLFALYKSAHRPSRAVIEEALSGNLCRCTGYRPIVAAASRMYDLPSPPAGTGASARPPSMPADETAIARMLRSLARPATFEYGARGQRYVSPRSLAGLATACALLPNATLIAGATDVALAATKQYRQLGDLIHVGDVAELVALGRAGSHLEIGAAANLTDAAAFLDEEWPELHEAWTRFASVPIRNSATLGGNVMNASPIGDSIPVLLALGASLELRSTSGTRELPVEAFYPSYRTTARQAGEVLVRIRVPRRRPGTVVRAYKVSKRADQDISTVFACFCLELAGSVVTGARIGVGGVAAVPKRALAGEAALAGRPWTAATARLAGEVLASEFSPIDDLRGSADYRRQLMGGLLQRFWLETGADAPRCMTRVGPVASQAEQGPAAAPGSGTR